MNAQVKGITMRPPKQTDPPGEGERRQCQQKQVKDLLLCWREGYKQSPRKKRRHLNAGHTPTSEPTGRPKYDETRPEDGPEKMLP